MESAMNEQILLEPFNYLRDVPGKHIRTKLIEAFDVWLKVPEDHLKLITEVTEMLHMSSLLIDDVEDDSELRRGVPVAHKIFGTPRTINCANYVYFVALEKLLTLDNKEVVKIFTTELLHLHRGQGMELYWRDWNKCPTEEEYIEMVGNKTGGLLRLAIKLMQTLSKSNDNFVPLVDLLGIHFQIRDDYLNLQSGVYEDNKGFAEDLTEGKFSFPIIHSIGSDPNNNQLSNILAQRTTDIHLKKYAINLMKKSKSFEYTLKRMKEFEAMVLAEAKKFSGENILFQNIVTLLSKVD
ncbi:Geranylgeranyl pyrophosphate synthase [Clydaea vesicula]|uniref:Geranylgeranyl pyrophosphate synthase n=1 Tax=Clydaea vesicula TaxID=447962 RepID=A0AAD5Y2Q9_9FUNG|nr:Geranylgeranyl pyrophosphate synthase [Clydaea vesicula]KAJ3390953.1 Geranylgeranyl pyrophosphate synthase [Lobulomyces angularis]